MFDVIQSNEKFQKQNYQSDLELILHCLHSPLQSRYSWVRILALTIICEFQQPVSSLIADDDSKDDKSKVEPFSVWLPHIYTYHIFATIEDSVQLYILLYFQVLLLTQRNFISKRSSSLKESSSHFIVKTSCISVSCICFFYCS